MRCNTRLLIFIIPVLFSLGLSACAPVTTPPASPSATPQPHTAPATPTPPNPAAVTDDPRLRQAVALCTDRAALARAAYPTLPDPASLVMHSFLPPEHPLYAGGHPQFKGYPYDPAAGRALLESAGWTLPPGADYRVDASGRELSLTLTASNAALRQAWTPVFAAQMQACGLRVEVSLLNAAQFFGTEGPLVRRQFDLAAYPGVIQPYPDVSAFTCAAIPSAKNGFGGANFAGWCNPAADAAAASIAQTLAADSLHADYQTLQIEASRDLPILPLFRRPEISAAAAEVQGFDPQPGQVYTWNAAAWRAPGRDTLLIGERSEPAGLHPLDSAWVNQTVQALIAGVDVTMKDFDYQPVTLTQLPTLENGGAVRDSSGRLTVTYTFRDDLTWSDGVPVTRADYELAYARMCDPQAMGDFMEIPDLCTEIESVNFISDTSYAVTYTPGYHRPDYFIPPLGRQPAHRQTGDGRRLADVPANEWATLYEVVTAPIGIGPYMLTRWEYGQEMVFESNPHYFGGPPATPRLIMRFLPQDQIESALLNSAIDLADSTSLWTGSLSAALLQAQSEGRIQLIVTPGLNYEQIAFRLTAR